MSILNATTTIPIHGYWIFIAAVLIIVGFMCWEHFEDGKCTEFGFFCGVLVWLFFVLLPVSIANSTLEAIRVEAHINDTVPVIEILDEAKLIERRGDIYVFEYESTKENREKFLGE